MIPRSVSRHPSVNNSASSRGDMDINEEEEEADVFTSETGDSRTLKH